MLADKMYVVNEHPNYDFMENWQNHVLQLTNTVTTLSFRKDGSRQTVQTQIRLPLEEQSIQGLQVCYSICIILTKYPKVLSLCLNFR